MTDKRTETGTETETETLQTDIVCSKTLNTLKTLFLLRIRGNHFLSNLLAKLSLKTSKKNTLYIDKYVSELLHKESI